MKEHERPWEWKENILYQNWGWEFAYHYSQSLDFSLVWLDVWEITNILSEVICSPSVKEPDFIICGGWGCKHNLHLGIAVARFMESIRIIGGSKSLKINIKPMVTTYDNVTKFFQIVDIVDVQYYYFDILDLVHHLSFYLVCVHSHFCWKWDYFDCDFDYHSYCCNSGVVK